MSDSPVPYQAYKPKRHSRTISNSNSHLVPNLSPPQISRPSTPISSPNNLQIPPDDASPTNSLNGRTGLHPAALEPLVFTTQNGRLNPPEQYGPVGSDITPESSTASSPDLGVVHMQAGDTKFIISRHGEQTSNSSTPSSSASSPASSSHVPETPRLPRKTTFRHVPLRNSRTPHPPSPLRPPSSQTHLRASSMPVASPSATGAVTLTTLPSTTSLPPNDEPPNSFSAENHSNRERSKGKETATDNLHASPHSAQSLSQSISTSSRGSHTDQTVSGQVSRESTPNVSNVSLPRATTPYRAGFQPKGVYRPVTDEFLAIRRLKQDGAGEGRSRVERTKLERRLEKLIALHFPPAPQLLDVEKDATNGKTTGVGRRKPKGDVRRPSSMFDFDLKNMNLSDPASLWKGIVGASESSGKVDTRAAEQRITPWQEDSQVSKCPLCSASFHPLTNRKHHCRLCGQIICSLPPQRPQRPVTCSLLFVVDPKTRNMEEVGEGVDYGVRRRRVSSVAGPKPGETDEEDKFLKGVRICRQCRSVLLRQKFHQESLHTPNFVKLYDVFVNLEKEIEDALPHFHEILLKLSHDEQPTKETMAARKRLLEAFAQYDALSKRIRSLPASGGSGSSQDRIQMAILTRASLFLQKNMFSLQSLPTPKKPAKAAVAAAGGGVNRGDFPALDADTEIANVLQPLLEQEAMLESFVEEAKSQRKFEDVKTLKRNLEEIRGEINRIVTNAEQGMGLSNGKGKANVNGR